jgi:hypothetical protein
LEYNVRNNHSKFERVVETTNKAVQIVALLAAGIWALWTWKQATAPSLKTGVGLWGDINCRWDASSEACKANVTVTIENIGQRNVVVSRVKYEISKAKPAGLESDQTVKVVDGLPESRGLVKEGDLDPQFLGGSYPPKTKYTWFLTVLFKPDMKEELWFKFEAFDPNNKLLNFWYGSTTACRRPNEAASR